MEKAAKKIEIGRVRFSDGTSYPVEVDYVEPKGPRNYFALVLGVISVLCVTVLYFVV